MPPKKSDFAARLWNIAVSPTIFVILSCLWCLDLGVGSILAFRRDPNFWMKMDSVVLGDWLRIMGPAEMPHSVWVYILVVLTWLMVLSLALCTVGWFMYRRQRRRSMAEVMLHLGFLLVFAGFVFGSGWGVRTPNVVAFGGEVAEVKGQDIKLKLDSVKIVRNERGEELETVSALSILDAGGKELVKGEARLNHPLIHGATVVYPQGGEERVVGGNIEYPGAGRVEVVMGRDAKLPGGGALRVKGALAEGQRYSRWVGPGAFVVYVGAGGAEEGGAFLGDFPLFRQARIGGVEAGWAGAVTRPAAAFNVHRDPGIQLVLIGAAILTFGTFFALVAYLKRG